MFLSAIRSNQPSKKNMDYQDSLAGWYDFTKTTYEKYGVNLECLSSEYDKEQAQYFLQTSSWVDVHPNQCLGPPTILKEYDLNTCSVDDIKVSVALAARAPRQGRAGGVCCPCLATPAAPVGQHLSSPLRVKRVVLDPRGRGGSSRR